MRDNSVDIHSHMLPAVDDGAEDYEMSLNMIRMSYEEGCRYLFLTPHADSFNYRGNNITEKFISLQKCVKDEGIDINLYLGSEIYFDPADDEDSGKIIKKLNKGKYPTMNGTKYVMIEFYLGGFDFDEVSDGVRKLIEAGYRPIIAHAERYGVPEEVILELREMGCLVQINLCDVVAHMIPDDVFDEMPDIISGWNSPMINLTNSLLSKRCVDFVGTDAHSIIRRTPKMQKYIEYLYANYPRDYIDDILFNNAKKMLMI